MIPNNVLSPLPIYESLDWQNCHNVNSNGFSDPLPSLPDCVPSFQIVRPPRAGDFAVYLVSDSGEEYISDTIMWRIKDLNGYQVFDAGGFNYSLGLDYMLGDVVYLRIDDGVQTWYSERFKFVSPENYTLVTFSNSDNMSFEGGILDFSSPWQILLDTVPAKPEYKFEEDVIDKDGYEVVLKQVSYKSFKMVFAAHEYLCDILRIIRMCDKVEVSYGSKKFRVNRFSVDTVDWLNTGNFANVECSFTTDTILRNAGAYEKYISLNEGPDYNNDYNADHKIK